jgi:CubicO group peptidase (beta-lactamase class C family)
MRLEGRQVHDPPDMAPVTGLCEGLAMHTTLNATVQQLLETAVADGRHRGLQAAAYKDGELVVDAWAGTMGPGDDRPLRRDSLFSSYSTTKGVAAAALHLLADRGQIEYAAPVARYWPAFAAHGKGAVTVAQAMSHQAGLHATPVPIRDYVLDWQRALDYVAGLAPAWAPGTATGYHALTYGWIVGGIVQGATGRHIKDVIQDEIARPLGVADELCVGIPDGVETRLTTLEQPPPPGPGVPNPVASLPPDHDYFKAMPSQGGLDFNALDVRKACLPSANGHFTARALARLYGALANGGEIDGVRLVSKERIAAMQRIQTELPDRVLFGLRIPKAIGFWTGGRWAPGGAASFMGARRTAFGHPGHGGSAAWADPEVGLSAAVTLNKLQLGTFGGGIAFDVGGLLRKELGLEE